MTADFHHSETALIKADIETVFDAIFQGSPSPSTSSVGAELERAQISGKPGEIGAQQQVRINAGALDLISIEVLQAFQRPVHITVSQRPDCLQRHDPHEREIPFLDSMIEDLDATFVTLYGDDPLTTTATYDLHSTPEGTEVTLAISVKEAPKRGWFAKRSLLKDMKASAATTIAALRALEAD